MFTIDEETVRLGIIGPFPSAGIEKALHLAVNKGKGELDGKWSIRDNEQNTFSLSYKHASNQGDRMSALRISGLADIIKRETIGDQKVYFWIDRIARRRLGDRQVNWGNLGLAPYGLFKTALAPQWDQCVIADEHKRMWLRMEAVLSTCCKGYFVSPGEEKQTALLANFRGVIGPSGNGQYPGMRYSVEDALKELAVSIICGNWDVTLTSFPQDKLDALDWASGVTQQLNIDVSFVQRTTERMVMRQIFSNDLAVTGRQLLRPADIGEMSDARRSSAVLSHPTLDYGPGSSTSEHPSIISHVSRYSNVIGKTVIVLSDSGDVFVSVDDCGWGFPVGHCGLVRDFCEEELTGQAFAVRSLRANDGMCIVLQTILEAKEGLEFRKACVLVEHVTRSENTPLVHVSKVIIAETDKIRFSWSA